MFLQTYLNHSSRNLSFSYHRYLIPTMNSHFTNEVYPSWNRDYVDIHGRDLKVMMADDGAIFVPLLEIRKSGFHIFPRSEFHFSRVGKSMVLNEFRLYMLGAAKEFLIQNNIHSLNHEDILATIEMCKEQLIKDDGGDEVNCSKSSGVLGRTLLSDPVTINKEVRSALQRNTQQISIDNSQNNIRGNDGRQALRMPHHKDSFKQENITSTDSNEFKAPTNRISGQQQQNQRNGFAGKSNSNQIQQGPFGGNRNRPNDSLGMKAKFPPKKDNDSKTASEIDESETFRRLSDCKIERIKLQKTKQKVKIVHIENSNDKFKYWVHLVEDEQKVLDIVDKCLEASVYSPVYSPKLGDICMAMSIEDDLWYRAVVQRLSPGIKVHFIDFGNNAIVSQVKKLPDELRSVAARAVRIVFSNQENEVKQFALDQLVSIRAIKEYADSTVLVTDDVQDCDTGLSKVAPSSGNSQNGTTLETCYWLQNKYSTVLVDGELVMIVAYEAGKFYLQNKEHHMKLKDISTFIKGLPKQPLKSVEKNQLVMCKKDGEDQMCRAVVRDVADGFVTVHFVDFHTNDSMAIKALYAVSRATVSLPVALIESPAIKGYGDDGLSEEAETLIDDMISKRQKFTVSMKGTEFDLLINGKSFSEMLFPSKQRSVKVDQRPTSDRKSETSSSTPHQVKVDLKPTSDRWSEVMETTSSSAPPQPSPKDVRTNTVDKPAKKTPVAAKPPQRIMFESMTYFEAPMGSGDYMLTAFKNSQDFTVTSTGDEESEMLSKCTCIELETDEGPYEPEDTEMVLARFEGGWFRGAVLEVMDNGKYQILFVEYGNTIEVTKEDVRRLPENLKTIPMLGLMCRIDVPMTDAVNKRLEELLKPENIYEMDFVSFDTENVLYTVKIPKVYDLLKKEGLL